MGQPNQEPSMEDILASIKRIIAEDSEAAAAPRVAKPRKGPIAVPVADPIDAAVDLDPIPDAEPDDPLSAVALHEPSDVLELTSPLVESFEEPIMAPPVADPQPAADSRAAADSRPAPATEKADDPTILSAPAETASRNAFAALSQLQLRAEMGQANTLDGLVADLLRPMLRDWLDRELPGIVERLVEAEVRRVSGRG